MYEKPKKTNFLKETEKALADHDYTWSDVRSVLVDWNFSFNENNGLPVGGKEISVERFKELADFDYYEYGNIDDDGRDKTEEMGVEEYTPRVNPRLVIFINRDFNPYFVRMVEYITWKDRDHYDICSVYGMESWKYVAPPSTGGAVKDDKAVTTLLNTEKHRIPTDECPGFPW